MLSEPVKKLFRPFPIWLKQKEFLDCNSTIKGFVSGVGAGKSKIGAYDLLCRAKADRLYMVTAPTYKVLSDATARSFTEVARYCGQLIKPIGGENYFAVILTSDGGKAEVLFRSTEFADRLRGPNLSGAWMDEGSLSDFDAYQNLVARLRQGGELGWLSLTFTPKGLGHWTWEQLFSKPESETGARLIRARTQDNPFLPPEFINQLKMTYGSGLRARQELDGEFCAVEGAEWPSEYFGKSIWFDDWPSDWTIRTTALDPSKGKDAKSGDYSAFVLLGRTVDGMLWCEADLRQGRTTETMIEDAIEHQRNWPADAFAVEANVFQELLASQIAAVSRARGMMLPIVPIINTTKKEVRIRRLGPHLAKGGIRFRNTLSTQKLVQQLRDFPEGEFDDGPDALELALRLMIEVWNGRQQKKPRGYRP